MTKEVSFTIKIVCSRFGKKVIFFAVFFWCSQIIKS